uniref:homeobox protein unc-4 homolog n=1 Tax=Halichoerus grypus TaxID=9711 RepID=UPI0016594518|nr:homeobox protein unc-4 homolog [Halichoerus grypus]
MRLPHATAGVPVHPLRGAGRLAPEGFRPDAQELLPSPSPPAPGADGHTPTPSSPRGPGQTSAPSQCQRTESHAGRTGSEPSLLSHLDETTVPCTHHDTQVPTRQRQEPPPQAVPGRRLHEGVGDA